MNLSEKMKILNSLKRNFTLMWEDLGYIENIKKYTKTRHNDRNVTEASKD